MLIVFAKFAIDLTVGPCAYWDVLVICSPCSCRGGVASTRESRGQGFFCSLWLIQAKLFQVSVVVVENVDCLTAGDSLELQFGLNGHLMLHNVEERKSKILKQ